jgi:hypothetical protein
LFVGVVGFKVLFASFGDFGVIAAVEEFSRKVER